MIDEERRQKIIAEMQKVVEESTPSGDDDPGLSTREWAKVWDVSIKTSGRRLRNLWETGMIETGKKRIECIDGSINKVSVYRVKKDTLHSGG
jgi:DNA-binding transcriptional regulator YhcF (GntR family)